MGLELGYHVVCKWLIILQTLKKTKMPVTCESYRSKTKSIFKIIRGGGRGRKIPHPTFSPLNIFNEIVFPVTLSTKRGENLTGQSVWSFNKRAGWFDVGGCIDKCFPQCPSLDLLSWGISQHLKKMGFGCYSANIRFGNCPLQMLN